MESQTVYMQKHASKTPKARAPTSKEVTVETNELPEETAMAEVLYYDLSGRIIDEPKLFKILAEATFTSLEAITAVSVCAAKDSNVEDAANLTLSRLERLLPTAESLGGGSAC